VWENPEKRSHENHARYYSKPDVKLLILHILSSL
jgi:hypothetical protein